VGDGGGARAGWRDGEGLVALWGEPYDT
jgi:hypothetical protein